MREAADVFLRALTEEKRAAAAFPFDNPERENWHYFPMDRGGVRLDKLDGPQRNLALALLSTGLSHRGFLTATQIIALENTLYLESGKNEFRNPERYHLAIFGTPGEKAPWGWRFEGHHLSLNFTLKGDQVHLRPFFFGTNPAEVQEGGLKGLRPLGAIEDAANQLANSLVKAEKSPVFSEKPPRDILTGQKTTAQLLDTKGVKASELSPEHQKALTELIDHVSRFSRGTLGQHRLEENEDLVFAWGGSLEPRQPHYFQIRGTHFVIEFANTQGNANHAHLVWRDLRDDFARYTLKDHLKKAH